jgi:hypothetical protein
MDDDTASQLSEDDGPLSPAASSTEDGRCWQCPTCCREFREALEQPVELWNCPHQICRACLSKSIALNRGRCPACQVPLHDLDLIAGAASTKEWVETEQVQEWRRATEQGSRAIRCCAELCPGVIHLEPRRRPAGQGGGDEQPWPVRCPACPAAYCGRCEAPWPGCGVEGGHLCPDLCAAQEEARALRRGTEPEVWSPGGGRGRRRRVGLGGLGGTGIMSLQAFGAMVWDSCNAGPDAEAEDGDPDAMWQAARLQCRSRRLTDAALVRAEKDGLHRPCPSCGVMTWREGGCNMVWCPNCHLEWCFACGEGPETGCTHFLCAKRENLPPPMPGNGDEQEAVASDSGAVPAGGVWLAPGSKDLTEGMERAHSPSLRCGLGMC